MTHLGPGHVVGHAVFEVMPDARARVMGSLEFKTVSALLPAGSLAIKNGQAAVIDLGGVTASDSSGLALLIEWLSIAKSAGHPLHFENITEQIHELARLSEVDALFAMP